MAKPTNPKLYARIKAKVSSRYPSALRAWPSAYAKDNLLRQYKAAGRLLLKMKKLTDKQKKILIKLVMVNSQRRFFISS